MLLKGSTEDDYVIQYTKATSQESPEMINSIKFWKTHGADAKPKGSLFHL